MTFFFVKYRLYKGHNPNLRGSDGSVRRQSMQTDHRNSIKRLKATFVGGEFAGPPCFVMQHIRTAPRFADNNENAACVANKAHSTGEADDSRTDLRPAADSQLPPSRAGMSSAHLRTSDDNTRRQINPTLVISTLKRATWSRFSEIKQADSGEEKTKCEVFTCLFIAVVQRARLQQTSGCTCKQQNVVCMH